MADKGKEIVDETTEGNEDKASTSKSGGTQLIPLPVKEKEAAKPTEDPFLINTRLIPQAELKDQSMRELEGLGLNIFNQDEFEKGVMDQVGQMLAEEEEKRVRKIIEKEIKGVEDDIRQTKTDLVHILKVVAQWSKGDTSNPEVKRRLDSVLKSKGNKLKQMKKLMSRKKVLQAKLDGVEREISDEDDYDDGGMSEILKKDAITESERERMIRVGEMTPFGTIVKDCAAPKKTVIDEPEPDSDTRKEELRLYLLNKLNKKKGIKRASETITSEETSSHDDCSSEKKAKSDTEGEDNSAECRLARRRKILPIGVSPDDPELSGEELEDGEIGGESDDEYVPQEQELYADSEEELDPSEIGKTPKIKGTGKPQKANNGIGVVKRVKVVKVKKESTVIRKTKDDGDTRYFQKRLQMFQKEELRRQELGDVEDEDEEFDGGLVVPGRIWSKLFKYQRTGVRWLWELHGQEAGGIVGDEMGLGKTIQMIAFLAALRQSKLRNKQFPYRGLGPCMIVCPTTVMHQWVKEFHKWWPPFRVAVLHSSGSYSGKESELIRSIVKDRGVIITSYNTLVGYQDDVLPYNWHYIVLDEGHKIRNPDAQATLVCKQFRTSHRLILSGSPIQNNLKELWSLFDFIFPGKLGTLPDFLQHFSVPIVQGGYSNASQIQVETAYRCASILRDTINPFLLRRMKADVKVNLDLPEKNEQVLFCRLTDNQHDVYEEYLASRECQSILQGKYQIFAGLITLRKICNHPDICTGGPKVFDPKEVENDESLKYGYYTRSGKMIVVEALLRLWKKQGHKVLLFSQSTRMLDILEFFVQQKKYQYLRMDGKTTIGGRQPLISKFNQDPNIYVFLLTTRVGGLGVNLTGANRVIIFDPDWNPSTDTQARERAWRIGQKKQVTIYRLLTSGTIEEKIYHRQIFKQFLSNRVLKDPKQRRLFKSNDIYELFTLGSKDNDEGTETSAIFAGTGSDVKMPSKKENLFDEMKTKKSHEEEEDTNTSMLDSDEMTRMRELARKLSQQMEKNKTKSDHDSETNNPSTSTLVKKTVITYADYKKQKLEKENGEKSTSKSDAQSSSSKHSHSRSKDTSTTSSSSHNSGKKHKKKKRDARFEGERIPHLVKQKTFSTGGGQPDDEEQQHTSHQDDYVLRNLFKKVGIQGAMKHDKIMDSGRPDYAIVEAEAEKVAKQAVAALRKSRTVCTPATSGVPTWTGQNGGVKRRFGKKKNSLILNGGGKIIPATETKEEAKSKEDPATKHFDGSVSGYVATTSSAISSDELLTRMRQRKQQSATSADDPNVETSSDRLDPTNMDLLTDIRNYVAFQARNDGQAMTQELLDHFGNRLPPGDSAKFKAMLRQLCNFDKTSGIGIWQLKEEFR
ncbi:hypothetical protein SNE40_005335 [Patella caerulea]|uniref:DNA excision repair protein ERCC-6 n=1 Tax=Patella caerulea TaxID=87958 RepID=A0AAN8K1G7_PATCE